MNDAPHDQRAALFLFSGGRDSTTCLAWALERFTHVETVAFDYRQRHQIELGQRLAVLDEIRRRLPRWADRLGEQLGGTTLVEIILEHSHTCYESERGPRHEWGHTCGECPACALRKRGFEMWRAR